MLSLKNGDTKLRDIRQQALEFVGRNIRDSRHLALDFLVYNGVLAICTLNGLLFRWLGFSDATIISVYILGVLISAVLTTNYIIIFKFY